MLIGLTGIAVAATWDLKTDWSDASNPNGVWTYRQGNVVLPFQSNWSGDQGGWALAPYPLKGHVPVWLKYEADLNGQLLRGDVAVHPTSHDVPNSSTTYDPANVIWTSPMNGTVSITGNIWWGGWTGNDRYTHWELFLNGVSLGASGTVGKGDIYDRDNPMLMNGGIRDVNTGDIVSLVVSEIDPNTFGWMTGVNLTITTVPAPAAILLLGSGILALAGSRLRQRERR